MRTGTKALLILLAIGSLALWTAVPAASLWAASKLARTKAEHFQIGLPMTVGAIIVWGTILAWGNALYLRARGLLPLPEDAEDVPPPRGPLEPLLVWSLAFAFLAFLVWFFAFAKNPPPDIQF